MRVGIIGMGEVGSALSYTLLSHAEVDELVLIDENENRSYAESLELKDCLSQISMQTNIIINNYKELGSAELVVICLAKKVPNEEDRMSELVNNEAEIRKAVPKIMDSGFNGKILVITNPCDVITMLVQELSGLPKNQVFGSGTNLDSMRLKRLLAEELGVNPQDIHAYMLGEHGESQIVPWSQLRYHNSEIVKVISSKEQQEEFTQKTRFAGWEIFKERGYTNYGIAVSSAAIIQTILRNEKKIFPVSVYDGEYDIYYSRPAILGLDGIEEVLELSLTTDETNQLEKSITRIKSAFVEMKEKK